MKITIITERYPVDDGMGGIGLRFWEMAQVFSVNHQVHIIVPRESDYRHPNVEIRGTSSSTWRDAIEWCDVVIFGDMPDPNKLLAAHRLGRLIVSDNAVPIEQLQYPEIQTHADRQRIYENMVATFKLQVLVSDVFITRSEVERATLISAMSIAGRLNHECMNGDPTLSSLILNVPIGFNSYSAGKAKVATAEQAVVDYTWSGGMWDYFDAAAVIDALSHDDSDAHMTVRFMYRSGAGDWTVSGRDLVQETQGKGLGRSVHFCAENIGHRKRDSYLRASRAILCVAQPGIENETCIRLRIRDALLYNLPIVVDDYGMTGHYVRLHDIGLAVPSKNPFALRDAMRTLLEDRQLYERCRANLSKLAASVLLDSTMDTLIERMQCGARSADNQSRGLRVRIEKWSSQLT